jgi:hypothetical protein
MAFRRTAARLVAIATLAVLMLLATASFAFAAPGEQTLGLAALQDKLDASPTGSLSGYLKTVVKGSTIVTIPVEVLALTGDSPSNSLIMFEASGTLIAKYGGIVAGMSGSPIYVEDQGVDKVIGALSYGDYFTLSGTGLATPIESMLQLLTDYSPRAQALGEPVLASGRVFDRVIISAHPGKLSAAAASGAFVARQLSPIYIGGLRPTSTAYKHLAASFAARGLTVAQLGTELSAGASDFSTDLVPGAAIGVLATRGDMWVGGLGTVTYTSGDAVLAFGHPAYWMGPTSLYMTNVWIAGVWPSSYWPYKLGYPSVIKGAITQDRYAGIMGEVGGPLAQTPFIAEAPFTAEVTDVTDPGAPRTATSSVWMSSGMLDSGNLSGAGGAACSRAGYKLFDSLTIPGSADTTVTIVVGVGAHTYTVKIANMFDDSFDIVYAMTMDVDWALYAVQSVLSDGLEQPHIVSVDLEAAVTSDRRAATIVSVDALAPLQTGDNTVRVSLLAYGVAATQTVDVTLNIPEGTPLTGVLTASSVFGAGGGDPAPPTVPSRSTVASIVDDLNRTRPNDLLSVTFVPSSGGGGGVVPLGSVSDETTTLVEVTAPTSWVLSGSATAQSTVIGASAAPITYGEDVYVDGTITGPTVPVEVRVYGVPAGASGEELLATGEAEMMDGSLSFSIPVSGMEANTELRLAVDGGYGYTPAEAFVSVTVRGRVTLSASPKTVWRGAWVLFTARVAPGSATGTIRFQYYDAHAKKWRPLIAKRLTHSAGSARATCMWRPLRGTWKVRAIYGGDADLEGATSSSVTVKVR